MRGCCLLLPQKIPPVILSEVECVFRQMPHPKDSSPMHRGTRLRSTPFRMTNRATVQHCRGDPLSALRTLVKRSGSPSRAGARPAPTFQMRQIFVLRGAATTDNPTLMDKLIYALFSTELGWIGVLGSEAGIRRLILPQPSAKDAQRLVLRDSEDALNSDLQYLGLWYRIRNYFSGQPVDFSRETLHIPDVSPFRKAVWNAVRAIPYGETRTYRWVAEKVGKPGAARAVGQALGANPVPIIIPCHRVVATRGLGGYGGGLDLKRKLLELETHHPSTTKS